MKTNFLRNLTGSFVLLMSMVSVTYGSCIEGGSQAKITYDGTGGDCTSIGQWNIETKTCILERDITCAAGVFIDGDGLTLDGNGYTISGQGEGGGVYVYTSNNVTVKNAVVRGYALGIYVYGSTETSIIDNILLENTLPQYLWNSGAGIFIYQGTNNLVSGNYLQSNGYGIWLHSSTGTNVVNNLFVDNYASVNDSNPNENTYNFDLPTGGNYWSRYDSELEGCNDADENGICDQPYMVFLPNPFTGLYDTFQGVIDYLPWKSQDINSDDGDDPGQSGDNITIEDFIAIVEDMVKSKKITNKGIANSLIQSMKNASAAVERGRMNAAARKVEAVINLITAQSGKKITSEAAQELLEKAGQLVHNLGD